MLFIDERSKIPIYIQVCNYFIEEIQSSRYAVGSLLPSIRALARDLNVSKSTIESAYAQLMSEGYIEGVQGAGYVVQDLNSILVDSGRKNSKQGRKNVKIYDFSCGSLSGESFPLSLWRKLTNMALSCGDVDKINAYGDKQGEYELRAEVAKYLHLSRGMNCSAEQIVMTNGVHSALETIVKLVVKTPLIAAMEEPGFDGARKVFINNKFKVTPVPVEEEGISVEKLWETGAGIVFTTPSHQMPSGVVMSFDRRKQLLKWADASDSYIIEDDYDHEFRYDIKPVKSLQSIDKSGCVIYIGTFSKVISPALRMSYFVLPEKLLPIYNDMFEGYYCMIPWLQQKIMTIYMTEGYWVKQVNRVFAEYKRKQRILLNALNKIMGDRVTISGETSGTHVMLEVRGFTQDELILRANKHNVRVSAIESFWHNKNDSNKSVVIGFNAIKERDIEKGVALLYNAWFA